MELDTSSKMFPYLENLALRYDITNVYKSCDSIESFEASLEVLLYEDREFQDYEILYFVFEGEEDRIEIDRYTYSLSEIALLFEGKLNNKIIHFANTKVLNIDNETAQDFLNITGAKALSGYKHPSPIFSAILDSRLFGLYVDTIDPPELIETLFKENYNLCKNLGLELHY